jgi:hypothetical protein
MTVPWIASNGVCLKLANNSGCALSPPWPGIAPPRTAPAARASRPQAARRRPSPSYGVAGHVEGFEKTALRRVGSSGLATARVGAAVIR